jgi:putative Mg2+ transporter-C (MgtC) family protein
VFERLITGTGFIGRGAILKEHDGARGTATAGDTWSTMAMGVVSCYGRYEIAIVLTLTSLGTLRLLTPLRGEAADSAGT